MKTLIGEAYDEPDYDSMGELDDDTSASLQELQRQDYSLDVILDDLHADEETEVIR